MVFHPAFVALKWNRRQVLLVASFCFASYFVVNERLSVPLPSFYYRFLTFFDDYSEPVRLVC